MLKENNKLVKQEIDNSYQVIHDESGEIIVDIDFEIAPEGLNSDLVFFAVSSVIIIANIVNFVILYDLLKT
tara:strand:- start:381 stop:593 length:213 start_codon:yes stop_codon:yes gene_type:complete